MISIRRATESDAAAIARLLEQLSPTYRTSPQQAAARLAKLAGDPRHGVLVATDESGAVVGWVEAAAYDSLMAESEAIVYGLVVDEARRGSGFGRQLMQQAESWARGLGCAALRLRTNVVRAEAHAFYEKLGYQLIKTQRTYRKPL